MSRANGIGDPQADQPLIHAPQSLPAGNDRQLSEAESVSPEKPVLLSGVSDENQCLIEKSEQVTALEDEVVHLKMLLNRCDDARQEMHDQVDRAMNEKRELENVLIDIGNKLSGCLPKDEYFDVNNLEQGVELLSSQARYSTLGRELLLIFGENQKPEDVHVDVLMNNLMKLREVKTAQDKLAESGITDPAPYIAFWAKFVETFDPTIRPGAIEPDHLLPNLQAVKGDADRLHKIVDAFKRHGWVKGDEELLSYLEALPSQIQQSKTK